MARTNLEPRERILIVVGAVVTVIVLGSFIVRGPLHKYKAIHSQVRVARDRLRRAEAARQEILSRRADQEALRALMQARGAGYSLWTVVTRAIQIKGLTNRAKIDSANREASIGNGVKLMLEGVSMEELVGVLYEVQGKDPLVILHKLDYLRPARDGKGLECSLVFISPSS